MVSIFVRTAAAAALSTALSLLPYAVSAETIYGAMEKAYQNNPDLNAVRAGLRATDEGVPIAKSGYRPRVSATATGTLTRLDQEFLPRPLDYHDGSAGITITQQVFDGFQTLNNVRAAEATVYSSRETLKANEISILLAAAESYSNIARDQRIVSIRKQNLAFLKEQLNAAEARLSVGEGTRTDVSQAQAELANAQALLVNAVAQLKESEAVYVQIVGDAPKGIKQPSPASKALPKSLDQAVATGLRENPSIAAAQYDVDAAGYRVKSAEGTMLPGVVVQGALTRSTGNEPGSNLDGTTASVTARLEIPLYQGGAEYGQIRQAKERLGQQRILVDSARADVQQTIVSAHAQLEAALANISANRAEVSAANMALDGVIEERKVGQRTTLDVLDAQQTVLAAEESLVSSQRNAVVASYSLLAAMGRLTVKSQGLQVAEYRAEEHYEAVKDKWFGLRTVDGR
ncbi:TolC family outer membrane protein [Rhizobium giardinii]